MLKAVASWLYANLLVGTFGLWLVGQVFRERYHITGLCLFVPSVVVAVALAVVALVAWLCTCRRAALVAALLAVPPTVVLLLVENRWSRPSTGSTEAEPLRLVHWNVLAGQRGWEKIATHLKAQDADIYVLSEAFNPQGQKILLKHLGAGYAIARARNMLVVVRGTVGMVKKELRVRGRAYVFEVGVDGRRLSLLVADLPSSPIIRRGPLLKQVGDLMTKAKPDLVVGDFNAPRRCRLFTSPPEGYAHAYYLAGRGWSYTWPAGFPLWAIDHCLVGPRLRAVRYDILASRLSDHCMQVLDFVVRKATANGSPP